MMATREARSSLRKPRVTNVEVCNGIAFERVPRLRPFVLLVRITCTGVLISPQPDLLPDVFCLMMRIFRLMLVLLYIYIYIYIYIYSINIPPIMIINRIHETQNLLSLQLDSFLIGLRTYQHLCVYITGVLISPQSDLLPDVFCLMVRIFRLMLVLLYI